MKNAQIKAQIKMVRPIEIILICFFALQFILICIANLTQLQNHIGYDCSSYYLQAIEMWKQKTVFPENWVYQTTLYWDSPVTIAMFIYGITKKIFLSYGIANIVCTTALIVTLYSIMKKIRLTLLSRILCLNLFLTPYVTICFFNSNDLGYYSMMFTSMGAYSVKLLIVLLIISVVINFNNNTSIKKQMPLIIITLILVLTSGVSSGYYILATAIIPLMFYFIVKMFVKNDIKVLISKSMRFLILNAGLILIGKKIATSLLNFTSKDSSMVWVGLTDFWKNIGSIFLGLLELLGALPGSSNISMLSIQGITFIFNLMIAIICITAIIYTSKIIFKKFEITDNIIIILSVGFVNLVIFVLSYTTYGSPIFETRYLIPIFVVLIFSVGYFIDNLNNELLIKKIGIIALCLSLVASNTVSYYMYFKVKNDYDVIKTVAKKVSSINTPVVYVYGEDLGISARNMRVIDSTKIYKYTQDAKSPHHWGDYTYYDETSEYQGETALIASNQGYENLPIYIKNSYQVVDTIGVYNIYKSSKNPIDFAVGLTEKKKNIDYMYTNGITVSDGNFNMDGEYITNGTGGFVSWGPYTKTKEGTYKFTLNYEVLESIDDNIGYFDLAINSGIQQVKVANLDKNSTSITLDKVTFANDTDILEYRVFANAGVKLKLKSIEITKE
ncbi:MAG: hypothetical protein WAX04_04660 [Oscillospiraceae bacterium]